jgi:4-hydroxybenzoate polyprenyltransferase
MINKGLLLILLFLNGLFLAYLLNDITIIFFTLIFIGLYQLIKMKEKEYLHLEINKQKKGEN